jgi:hypothetical protein
LQSGGDTVGKFVLTLFKAAMGDDAATLHNKVTVANFYETQCVSHDVPYSATEAQAALAGVTHNVSTVGIDETSILASL